MHLNILLQSFSEMFVRFLEMESTPSLPAPKLPVHDIKPLSAAPQRRTTVAASSTLGGKRPLWETCSQTFLFVVSDRTDSRSFSVILNMSSLIQTHASLLTGPAAATKRTGESNLFLAPRSAAVPLLAGSSSGSSGGHLLMKPISDALPTFTPVPVSAEASAGAVLKDLLKQWSARY